MGTVSVSLPSDGQTIDAADYNVPINTIVSTINGGIDNDNITDGTVTSEKLSGTIAFRATTTQSISNSASPQEVTTYTEVFDTGGDFDHTTGIFTAPVTGLYAFYANASFNNINSASARLECWIVTTNGDAKQFANAQVSTHDPGMNCSLLIKLTAGDTAKMRVTQDAGTFSLAAISFFSGYFVGVA